MKKRLSQGVGREENVEGKSGMLSVRKKYTLGTNGGIGKKTSYAAGGKGENGVVLNMQNRMGKKMERVYRLPVRRIKYRELQNRQ
jgi:hypothetical protein